MRWRRGVHITDFLRSKGIGWTAWVFHPEWRPSLISDWSYTPREPQGVFFQSQLQGR